MRKTIYTCDGCGDTQIVEDFPEGFPEGWCTLETPQENRSLHLCETCFNRTQMHESRQRRYDLLYCTNHDKVYSTTVYATCPPKVPWICRICGAEGVDQDSVERQEETYEQVKDRFAAENPWQGY